MSHPKTPPTTDEFKAIRHSEGKTRVDLVPVEWIENLAKVMESGINKGYPEHNWKKGLPEDSYYGSCLRHIIEHKKGNYFDLESHQLHLEHAAWNLLAWSWSLRAGLYDTSDAGGIVREAGGIVREAGGVHERPSQSTPDTSDHGPKPRPGEFTPIEKLPERSFGEGWLFPAKNKQTLDLRAEYEPHSSWVTRRIKSSE